MWVEHGGGPAEGKKCVLRGEGVGVIQLGMNLCV